MDVRQFDFLARQPSATLVERPSFWGMPKRGLVLILINALFWQPLIAQADGIVVSGSTQTSLNQAGNGVPIVNIAAPNASGLSHNQYQQFNVGAEGVILNNTTARTQNTQLGGIIVGNPNFTGTSAGTILNEVVGANASQLKGYTEVAGPSARVIVANPYGVSCNGCGFINTPRVTLTTGKPVLDNGRLDRFQVDGGSISIDGAGLNADNVDQFEIITRAAQINAQINARQLTIVAGRNDVDAQTLNATARADDGSSKPVLAIDSAALGGMYAGAIKLVGTEAGVGVRVAGNLAASAGDIQIDSNGQLSLMQTSATGVVNVKATGADVQGAVYGSSINVQTSGALNVQQNIAARDSVTLGSNGQLTNIATVEAGVNADNNRNTSGDVSITAQNLRNSGSISGSRSLTANVSQTLNNQGGTLNSQVRTQVTAGTLDNRQSGRVLSQGSLGITANQLLNTQSGLVSSAGDLAITAGSLDNSQQGTVSTGSALTVRVTGQLLNSLGILSANGNLVLGTGTLDNRNGEISSLSNLSASASQADNSGHGRLLANGDLALTFDGLNNQNTGAISGQRDVTINVGQLNNTGVGSVYAKRNLNLSAANDLNNNQGVLRSDAALTVRAASLANTGGSVTSAGVSTLSTTGAIVNQGGEIRSDSNLNLTSASLDNSQQGRIAGNGVVVTTGAFDNYLGGSLSSTGALQITASALNNNAGSIASAGTSNISSSGALSNQNGAVLSDASLNLTSASLDNSQAGRIAGLGVAVNTGAFDNHQNGSLTSTGTLQLTAAQVNNSDAGRIASALALTAYVTGLDQHNDGRLFGNGDVSLDLNNGLLNNQNGLINAPGQLLLKNLNVVNNQSGEISSSNDFTLAANSLDNTDGSIISSNALTVSVQQQLTNLRGLISGKGVVLNAGLFSNQQGGRLTSTGVLQLNAGQVNNTAGSITASGDTTLLISDGLVNQGGKLLSNAALNINSASLDNSQQGRIAATGVVLKTGVFDNHQGGQLSSTAALQITADQLNNTAGSVASAGASTLTTTGAIVSQGGEILSDASLTLTSASLDNSQKGRIAGKGVVLNTGAFDNHQNGSLTSTGTLQLTAAQVNNSDAGRIASAMALTAYVTGLDQHNNGRLFGNGDVSLDLNNGLLNNQNGLITAPGQLLLKNLNVVNNQSGEISSANGFSLAANRLDNTDGSVISDKALIVRVAQQLANIRGSITGTGVDLNANELLNDSGSVSSDADLSMVINTRLSSLKGELSAAGTANVTAASLDNAGGQITADQRLTLNVAGDIGNQAGTLGAGKGLTLQAASLDNSQAGSVVTDGDLGVTLSGALNNSANGSIEAKGAINLASLTLDNRAGRIATQNLLTVRNGSTDNRGGAIRADQNMQLLIDSLDNSQKGVINSKAGLSLTGQSFSNQSGLLSATGPVQLQLGNVLNGAGRIASQDDLTANIDNLAQQGGEFVAQGNLTLTGTQLDNRAGGLVGATKALKLNVANIDNRAGEMSSQVDVSVTGQQLNNSDGGKVLAGTALGLTVDHLINQSKGLLFGHTVQLSGMSLDNSHGTLGSQQGLSVNLSGALDNSAGLLSSEADMTVNADSLQNAAGSLSSATALTVTSAGALLNQGGSISTDAGLNITSASLDNRNGGSIAGKGTTRVDTGAFDNSHGGRLTSSDSLTLNAGQVTNQDTGRIASALNLDASVTGLDQQGGQLFSNTALTLDLNNGQLNNQGGLINAPGALLLKNLNGVNNQNGEISSAQAFTLAAQNLDNSGGKLISNQSLTLRIAQVLNNLKGAVSAQGLDITSASLDNTEGLLSSHAALNLSVANALTNHNGTLIADDDLLLSAATADNSLGQISSKKNLNAQLGDLQQQGGQLIALGTLSLTGNTLDNRLNGLIGATQALTLHVANVDNRGGEVSSQDAITVNGQQLNNSDSGKVLAQQALALNVSQISNRNKGLLSGKAGFTVIGNTLDNTGGSLVGLKGIDINLAGLLDNSQGLISSEDSLTARVGSLINNAGSVSSAGLLTLNSVGAITSQGGELVTDGAMTLHSASLDNSAQGSISSKGALAIVTGDFDNSQTGRVSTGDRLDLTAAQLTNRDGGSIGSSQALVASVSGLDQQNGKLFSNTALTLDLNNGQLNNQGGLINAPGALLLKNLNGVNNQNGEISSTQAFTLAAQSLNNSGGKMLSNQGLTVRIAQALSNVKGMIAAASLDAQAGTLDNSGGTLTSRGDLQLTSNGQLSNGNDGLINAAQALTVRAGNLDNQGGQLLANSALSLNAAALNNTANGLINSLGSLTLTADSLDSSNGGEVSAHGDINLTLNALTQTGGRLLGDNALTLDLNGADLNTRSGLITAKGPLTFNRLRNINNQGGEISSSQSFTLTGGNLDNTRGKLISSNLLTLNSASLINQNGLISGWQGLSINGGTLDNSNNGTLSSRSGDVFANLSGALLNSNGGALVSQKALTVNAASLDNRSGILSSGAAQTLTVNGLLDNSQSGLIDSGAGLTVNASTLSNAAGNLTAQQDISFTGSALDNSAGNLSSKGAVTLDLIGALTNTNGKLASGGALLLRRSSQIANQGGQLISQSLMTLNTASLDNRNRGTVAANNSLVINSSGAVLNNADGLIYSQNADLQLQANSLSNGNGALQSQGALNVNVAGDIDNQTGRIIAQGGDLGLSASNLYNQGGVLSSLQGAFTARVTGVLKNGYDGNRQGGVIQAQRLDLSALGGFDNYGGRVSARSGDALISTGNFDNRNGGLYAKGRVSVTGNNFDNSGDNDGQIAANQIDLNLSGALNNRLGIIESDSTLSVTAASVDNQTGKLRALGGAGSTQFNIGGTFDNRNGVLESANSDLNFNVGSFLNTNGSLLHVGNGEFRISTANVTNGGGSIVTRGGLTLNADSWTNSSVIQAGRLTVNVNNFNQTASGQLLASSAFVGTGGNWNNDGLIASDGSLNLNIGGTYSGNGRMSSLGNLSASAAQMTLNSATTIAGGGSTAINVGGQLTNYGRLTSASDLTVNAGGVSNYGTLGAAQDLTITTPTLLNDHGLIFSGQNTRLLINDFKNLNAAVYSVGDFNVLGLSKSRAGKVENLGSSIDVDGDFSIAADGFFNKTEGVVGAESLISGDITYDPYSGAVYVNESYESKSLVTGARSSVSVGGSIYGDLIDLSNVASLISAGKNIEFNVDTFENLAMESGAFTRSRVYNKVYNFEGLVNVFTGVVYDYSKRNSKYIYNYGRQAHGIDKGDSYFEFKDLGKQKTNVLNSNFGIGPEVAVPAAILNSTLISDNRIFTSDTNGVASTIQAGRSIEINATKNINNSLLQANTDFLGTTKSSANTQVQAASKATVVYLNPQLAPDLAQQQVNPLSLPGFSLPTGQNGLFRLSGQSVSTTQATQASSGPQSWTVGGASVSVAQREQVAPDAQARSIQIASVGQVSAAAGQLATVTRQIAGISANASAFDTSAPVDTGNGTSAAPGHQSDSAGLTSVGNVVGIQTGVVAVDKVVSAKDVTAVDAVKANTASVSSAAGTAGVQSGIAAANTQTPGIVVLPGQNAGQAVISPSITQVAPTTSQTVNKVQGLPSAAARPNSNKYLIETNPVLTDLKQFMSSDYLLSGLGYDPDTSAKRLGDGFYEQRLVQQAVTARTGQAFIDGQTSNEAQFKYLMNNAIASKDALNLSVGVSLTSEQVAALTHDIVWMEDAVVNGETVLVPVLYLANANNRLAPNGALIQGSDVTLIAGKDLNNAGTLRASNNLSAAAGNDLINSGLIEAGNRLDLLAGNNVINKAGGIIAGRDVSITAINGDVINERTVTTHESAFGSKTEQRSFIDNAARIEAANDLTVQAGRDVINSGGVLQSGRDTSIAAGRDVNLVSAQQVNSNTQGSNYNDKTIIQNGSTVNAGRDLSINAGRDLSVVASQIDAKRDIAMAATENLTLSSAADEEHSYAKTKKVTAQEDHVSQVSTSVTAGGNIAVKAGIDLGVIASRINAGENVSLDAGQDVYVASAQNEDYSYYKKKKTGSFGRSSTRETEAYDTSNVGSVIEAGHDLTVNASQDASGATSINGGRDVMVVGSQLKAGNDILLGATGDVSVVSGVEEHGAYSKKTKSGLFGINKSGKSELRTTESQVGSQLQAGNDAIIAAGKNVQLSASTLAVGNDAELHAGLLDNTGDINLASASDSAYSRAESYKKKMGFSLTSSPGERGISVGSSTQSGHEVTRTTGVGSQVVAGGNAILDTAHDINIVGSSVNAQNLTSLSAGRDVNITASNDSFQSSDWNSKKNTGISFGADRNGFSMFAGKTATKETSASANRTAGASSVSGYSVNVDAVRDISLQGADVYADSNIALKAGRDIRVDAAAQSSTQTSSSSVKRDGISGSINHNYGNTADSVKNAGKGDDGVSKVSSTLAAVDSINQFTSGPTMSASIGSASQSQSQTVTTQSNRSSTLQAGNDITMAAGNDVTVRGSSLQAGRDINVKGRDVTFDVAKGTQSSKTQQNQSKGGINGGTSGGFKVGLGASNGIAKQSDSQGTSDASQLSAGRDINIDASNDLKLIGTQAQADRDISLRAGNDLTVRAAQNDSSSQDSRHSGGGEVGLTLGQSGVGVYASVNLGRGNLDREAAQQQEAYLYAGKTLGFESARDTTVAGATLRGDDVVGKVGRDLSVSSMPDTGKVTGKQFDVSATLTVGAGASASGSVGYGKTTGSTDWVGKQTSISAKDRLDIQTEQHTQLDGAVLSSDSGNLKLDTGTLGFSDIAGKDKEHGYYLNVGGTYGLGGSTTTQDSSQVSKGDAGGNGWSVNGYNYNKDREQIVRATVGAGDITVRDDTAAGSDSTTGLNRDVSKAYEITKDEEHRTDLYASSSSVDAVSHPVETSATWAKALVNYDQVTKQNFDLAARIVGNQIDSLQNPGAGSGAVAAGGEKLAEQALSALVEGGIGRGEARELLADKDFQASVLKELAAMTSAQDADPAAVADLKKTLIDPLTGERNIQVTNGVPRTAEQKILYGASYINQYIEQNPEKATLVEIVLAAAQGPKGIMMLAAQKALGDTAAGQKLAEYSSAIAQRVGQTIAETLDQKLLNPQKTNDKFVIGGGSLMAMLLVGTVTTVGAKSSSTFSARAESGASAVKLRTQLAAQEIAGGHAFEKHVLVQGEFKGLDIRTREQFASHVENVMTNPSSVRYYKDGRTVYLQESTGTVVFRNPNGGEGTAFQPKNWKEYTSTLPVQTAPY
jgi:filamentous hemagglutinin